MNQRDFEKISNALRDLSELVYNLAQNEKTLKYKRLLLSDNGETENRLNLGDSSVTEVELERRHLEDVKKLFLLSPSADAEQNEASQLNFGDDKTKKCVFTFSKKEMQNMPKLKDLSYRYKKEKNLHEFRYRKNGVNKSFSSTSLQEAKRKAMEFCKEVNALINDNFSDKDVLFNDFIFSFMNDVKRNTYAEKSFYNEMNRVNNHILPNCAGKRIKDITAPFIQRHLNSFIENENFRTAEALYYLYKMALDYAEHLELIKKNPIFFVDIPLHERKNGVALSKEDEKIFLDKIRDNKYRFHFLLYLYTGCRPCELYTFAFTRTGFLTFRNRKQKKGKIVFKDIPISPMLEPYVDEIKKAMPLKTNHSLSKTFSNLEIGEQYKLYSLRHTFATRTQECGVPEEIVQAWMGQTPKTLLGKVYTHYTDNFMLELAKKVEYTL